MEKDSMWITFRNGKWILVTTVAAAWLAYLGRPVRLIDADEAIELDLEIG